MAVAYVPELSEFPLEISLSSLPDLSAIPLSAEPPATGPNVRNYMRSIVKIARYKTRQKHGTPN